MKRGLPWKTSSKALRAFRPAIGIPLSSIHPVFVPTVARRRVAPVGDEILRRAETTSGNYVPSDFLVWPWYAESQRSMPIRHRPDNRSSPGRGGPLRSCQDPPATLHEVPAWVS